MRGWIRLTAAAVFLLAGAGCARDTADSQPAAQEEVRTTAPAQEETNTVESIRAVIVTEATTGQTEPEQTTHVVSEPIDFFDETQVTQPARTDAAPWSYRGTVPTEHSYPEEPVYGFEFELQYDTASKGYHAVAGMGACDQIEYYILTHKDITVAISKNCTIGQTMRSVGGSCAINQYTNEFGYTAYRDTHQAWGASGLKIWEDGQYCYFRLNFSFQYEQGEIQELSLSFGKVD